MAHPTRRLTLKALIGATAAAPSAAGAARFTPYPHVKAALMARQSGLFKVASLGTVEIILLCVNGAAIDVHARRNGIYQPKDASRSHSPKAMAPVDFNRLITAAGGLDTGVNGSPRQAGFYALYNHLAVAPTIDAFGVVPVADEASQRLGFSTDPFFAGWTFVYDARPGTLTFTAGDLRAHWILEGHP
jgi:hypothetical protein